MSGDMPLGKACFQIVSRPTWISIGLICGRKPSSFQKQRFMVGLSLPGWDLDLFLSGDRRLLVEICPGSSYLRNGQTGLQLSQ